MHRFASQKEMPFDVESLAWEKASTDSILLGREALMQDVLRDARFPRTIFVRYRFPRDTGRRSPFLIVSFSGNDVVLHRANALFARESGRPGEANRSGREMMRLFHRVFAHWKESAPSMRIWTGLIPPSDFQNVLRAEIRAARKHNREHPDDLRFLDRDEVERGRARIARWVSFAQRQGFDQVRNPHVRKPSIIQKISPYDKPYRFSFARRKPRAGK